MYQQLNVWSHSVFVGLLSAGILDAVQYKSEQPWFRLEVKVTVSELQPCVSQHGKSVSGGGQNQTEGKITRYEVIISSCNMEVCTSLSISQDMKGSIIHLLVNQCCSLPLVNVVKWSNFGGPVYIPVVSSSKTTLCLTSALCSWSYF